ncbi:hypothetical protein BH23ACT9_BH23ACT9_09770 [soil metagenome]
MARWRDVDRRDRVGALVRRASVVAAAVTAVLALVIGAGVLLKGGGTTAPVEGTGEAPAVAALDQSTLLLLREDPATRGAAGITLLATSADGRASATFIPSTTLVEIPGAGLDRLGLAHSYGGASLAQATLENAIGIEIDHVAVVGQGDLGSLLQRAGGADVAIADRLVSRAVDGTGTVVFEAGEQYLNGPRLAEYWGFVQRGETELDTFPRQQRALGAMLGALADDVLRESLFAEVPGELATDADPAFLRSVMGQLAQAAEAEVLVYQLLPVAPFGSTDEALGASYQLRHDEVADLVTVSFAASIPEGALSTVRVQVLNGVGTPGVGRQVDESLADLGFRIVLAENARSFDFTQTQIVIYEETPEMLRAARQVREAMGVGTILVSRQPQSVVDVTIVVGADFLGQRLGSVDER